ncbi:hypothetical protein ACNO8X_26055 [Mycobacterium sp. PDNC021]|uniref:hypothetical protein n=1 Tax=Mycobacterium sp. PDNC021 TaxID=3391399 RepID=UPI003AAC90B8
MGDRQNGGRRGGRPKLIADGGTAPPPAKRPFSSPPAPDKLLTFRFGRLDHDKWALCKIERGHHKRLLERLAYFETLTVEQARANHVLSDYDMSEFPNKNARKRLNNQYDGHDALCGLKIAPSEDMRLFGIREGHEFHIIWWDPGHEVWNQGKNVR